MTMRSALCCALVMAVATCAWGAPGAKTDRHGKKTAGAAPKAASKPVHKTTTKAPPKKRVKPAPKSAGKTAVKGSARHASKTPARSAVAAVVNGGARPPSKWVPRAAAALAPEVAAATHRTALKRSLHAAPALRGKRETLACTDGTEDRQARIGVALVGGKVDGFAYYSKWKPRTCSIYLQRNRDGESTWVDNGAVTTVNMAHGLFLIERHDGEYRFVFRDVDRERYCGMDGTINGTLTIRKGSERCELTGIMDEGVPLGEAYAHVDQPDPPAAAQAAAPEVTPARETVQRNARRADSAFPAAAVGVSD